MNSLKKRVFESNLELPRRGLVTYTWGNVSGIDRKKSMIVIKPSGISYETMTIEDMVVTDLDGKIIEGKYKPSSDLATHIVLYKAFPEIGGIVHTHSKNATAWAQAGMDIPALGTTHADYFYGPIPCTRKMTIDEIQGAYEYETGNVIVETFNERSLKSSDVEAALVFSHGPFTWGESPEKAVHNTVVLEELAYIANFNLIINPNYSTMQQELLDKHYLRKHGKNAYYGQN